MNSNGRLPSDELSVTTSFSELTHDVIELAELQAQLFALDIKETSQSTRNSLLLVVAGACVLVGAIPVALMALAELLVEEIGWSSALSYAAATLVGIVIGVGLILAAYVRFRTGVSALSRSREELGRNVAWIKSSLRNRGRPGAAIND